MKTKVLAIATLLALGATAALAGGTYQATEGSEEAPRGRIVVSERVPAMSVFDYFFNNPEKYRTMRNGPGEYYKGPERR